MDDFSMLEKLIFLKAANGVPLHEYTATGNPLTFNTNKAKPLKQLLVAWTPLQSGTGDPSPENVRPITGMDGVTVWHTGKNLANPADFQDGKVWWNGSRQSGYNSNSASEKIPVVPGAKYTLNRDPGQQGYVSLFGKDGSYLRQEQWQQTPVTKTIADDVYFIAFTIAKGTEYQLEVGETASTIEPYSGTTYAVEFPALGKNLFNKNDPNVKPGVWWKGNVLTSGDYGANYTATGKIPVIPGETYTLTRESTAQGAVCYFNAEGTYVSQETWDRYTPTRAIPSGVYFLAFTIENGYVDTAMFNKGSTALPYEPYTNTVYGGSLDLATGVLTAEWNGFRKTWGDGTSATDMGDNITRKIFPMVDYLSTGINNNICNVAPYGASEDARTHFYYSGSGSTNRNCRLFLPSDTPDSTEVVVITKLSQPFVIATLSPTQITALLGNNTIWSDADDLIVTYLKKG